MPAGIDPAARLGIGVGSDDAAADRSHSRRDPRRPRAHGRGHRAHAAGAPERRRRAAEIYLKLENLQPIGSFKLRGAGNAMRLAGARAACARASTPPAPATWRRAWPGSARELGMPCTVVVPDHAPATKLAAIERLGGRIVKVPFDRWWQVLQEQSFPGLDGLFIHPFGDPAVMAGNGTDRPGDPGRPAGRGRGDRPLRRRRAQLRHRLRHPRPAPQARVYAAARWRPPRRSPPPWRPARRRVELQPSFVDGIGGKSVFAEMWPLASRCSPAPRGSLEEVAAAVRLLAERNRVIAEGAGAASVAAALAGVPAGRKVVCVVSGGNIDAAKLAPSWRAGALRVLRGADSPPEARGL